jgi:hypothetical protein
MKNLITKLVGILGGPEPETGVERMKNFVNKTVVVIALAIGTLVAFGNAQSKASPFQFFGHVKQIQVYVDKDATNLSEYSYCVVYFSEIDNGPEKLWVVPLQKDGIDISGSKYLESILQQGIATGAKMYFEAMDSWGINSSNFTPVGNMPRLRRVVIFDN